MKIKIKNLRNFFFSGLAIFLFAGCFFGAPLTAKALDCAGTKAPSEGIAGVSILQFDRAIVPCGRSCDDSRTPYDEQKSCTVCHLLIMVKNIFDLMFAWIIILALLSLTIGGVTYLVSAGNPGTVTIAKGIISKTLMGFAGFLLSWLLVYTILVFISANESFLGVGSGGRWYEFQCVSDSVFDTAAPSSAVLATTGLTGATGTTGTTGTTGSVSSDLNEQNARDALIPYDITVWESSPGATNVSNLLPATTQGVIDFQSQVGAPIIITGGAETSTVHNTTATFSHANGYKVDIEDTLAVNNYIVANFTPAGVRGDGAVMYEDSDGNIYAREDTHWDVCYNCN